MALNTTIFSGSGSADNEFEQAASEVPEYASYVLLCVYLLSIPVVIVPASLAIVIIVKNKKLQTNGNIFLINLLLTDVGIALTFCTNGLLTVLYLLGVNVDPPCNLILTSFMLNVFANKLMFIPMCVDQFIHIAFPFSYKRIVTTKAIKATIITLWIAVIVISISLYINELLEYITSVSICKPTQTNIPSMLIMLLRYITPIVLITVTSIYLRQRIIKSKNFFHNVKRSAAQERKSIKAGRLAEILQEQVKPTLAVFKVGGIDAVLDILIALISAVTLVFSLSTAIAFVVSVSMAITIQYLQSANHALVYNIDIREKMISCIKMRNKHNKVIVLQRQ